MTQDRGSSIQSPDGIQSTCPSPGLPWECQPNDFGVWWQTAKLVLLEPTQAFLTMRRRGGLGTPLLYAIWGQSIGMFAYMLWYFPLQVISVVGQGGDDVTITVFAGLIGTVIGGALALFVIVPLGMFAGAAIQHLCLKIVGADSQPYETTFRVMCFAYGSIGWVNMVPFCGPLIGVLWGILCNIIGNAHAHECSVGKAVGAFFLSILLVFVVCLIFYGVIFAVIVAIPAAAAQA